MPGRDASKSKASSSASTNFTAASMLSAVIKSEMASTSASARFVIQSPCTQRAPSTQEGCPSSAVLDPTKVTESNSPLDTDR